MFVWVEYGQKPARWGNHAHLVSGAGPIDNPRSHFAVTLDGHGKKTAVQGARRQRISAFVLGIVGPAQSHELSGLEIDIVPWWPLEGDRFRVGQFQGGRLNFHFNNRFCHSTSFLRASLLSDPLIYLISGTGFGTDLAGRHSRVDSTPALALRASRNVAEVAAAKFTGSLSFKHGTF